MDLRPESRPLITDSGRAPGKGNRPRIGLWPCVSHWTRRFGQVACVYPTGAPLVFDLAPARVRRRSLPLCLIVERVEFLECQPATTTAAAQANRIGRSAADRRCPGAWFGKDRERIPGRNAMNPEEIRTIGCRPGNRIVEEPGCAGEEQHPASCEPISHSLPSAARENPLRRRRWRPAGWRFSTH
jgi:hypothetical protein